MSNGLDDKVSIGGSGKDGMVNMGGYGNTTWTIRCKSDPRFNAYGIACGVFDADHRINEHIKNKIKELGLSDDQIPEDIEISAWKD
jgi:hypothetical protein